MLLISVLVCLAVVMLLFAGWIRTIVMERQQVRAQQDRLQAELLAGSAVERAVAQLAANTDYPGEIWQLGTESFGGRAVATVEIRVTRLDNEPRMRLVRAVADFPAEGAARARRSKEIKVALKTSGESP
jgi:hypothetical protein